MENIFTHIELSDEAVRMLRLYPIYKLMMNFHINEAHHINQHIPQCAIDIARQVKDMISAFKEECDNTQDAYDKLTDLGFFNTEYGIIPKEELAKKYYTTQYNTELTYIKKIGEMRNILPIQIMLGNNMPSGTNASTLLKSDEYAVYINDKIIQLSKKDTTDFVKIILNVVLIDNYNIDITAGIIAHELQHAFEQFLYINKNIIKNPKNHYSERGIINTFDIPFKDAMFVEDVLYMISPDEQRARIQAAVTYLKSTPKGFLQNIYRILQTNFQCDYKRLEPPFNVTLPIAVGGMVNLPDIERLTMFKKINIRALSIMNTYKTKYSMQKIVLIIGYYLFNHQALNFKLSNTIFKEHVVKLLLSKSNIDKFIKNPNDIILKEETMQLMELIVLNIKHKTTQYNIHLFDAIQSIADEIIDYEPLDESNNLIYEDELLSESFNYIEMYDFHPIHIL